jgi:hypothetical protein
MVHFRPLIRHVERVRWVQKRMCLVFVWPRQLALYGPGGLRSSCLLAALLSLEPHAHC